MSRLPQCSSDVALLVWYGLHVCVCRTLCYYVVYDVAHLCFYMFLRCSKFINLWLPHSCFWIASCLVFASKNVWKVFKNKLLHRLIHVSLQNVARREPSPPTISGSTVGPDDGGPSSHTSWEHRYHCCTLTNGAPKKKRMWRHQPLLTKTHRIDRISSDFFLSHPFYPILDVFW